jgi:phospholipid/cholesterol/gamma-HCH transport system substrate-binding protein
VLARGVEIGSVEGIQVQGDRALITFSVQSQYAPIYKNATVQTGNRTLLGEPYLNLDPGTASAGRLKNGSTLPSQQVLPTVQFDQALKALNKPTITHLRSIYETFNRGFESPQAPAQVSGAFGSLATLVHQLRRLTDTLHGQDSYISGLVSDGGTVLQQLGEREGVVRAIVSGGRQTLAAIASRQAALQAAMAETPKLLDVGRRTLAEAQPLLVEARPLIADIRAAAPDLPPTFAALRPTARDATTVIDALPALDRAAVPALQQALPVVNGLGPLARWLVPTFENTIPVLGYLEPRANVVSALFSNLGETLNHGDNRGMWIRYNTIFIPGPGDGNKGLQGKTFVVNPYQGPNGNIDPQAFTGKYQRLTPYMPGHQK